MSVVEILAKTAEGVQERVGSVGSRRVNLGGRGERLNAITLGRGGFVVDATYDGQYEASHATDRYTHGKNKGSLIYPNAPKLVRPFLDATVIYIGNQVGRNGEAGKRYDNPDTLTTLDSTKSRDYLLLRKEEESLWGAYNLAEDGVTSNYWTGMNTYYLGDATEITTTEAALSILGLLEEFDRGIQRAHDEALAWKCHPPHILNTPSS